MARTRPKPPPDDTDAAELYDSDDYDLYAAQDETRGRRGHAGYARVTFAIATSPDTPPLRLSINWLTLTLIGAVAATLLFLAGLEIYNLIATSGTPGTGDSALQSNTSLAREQQLQKLIDAEQDRLNKLQDENKKRRDDLTDLEGRINSLADILADLKRQADVIDAKLGIAPQASPAAPAATPPAPTATPPAPAASPTAPKTSPTPAGRMGGASAFQPAAYVRAIAPTTAPDAPPATTAVPPLAASDSDKADALNYQLALGRVEAELRKVNLSVNDNRDSLDNLGNELTQFATDLQSQRSALEDRVMAQQLRLIALAKPTATADVPAFSLNNVPGGAGIVGGHSGPNQPLDPNAPDSLPVSGPISQGFGCTTLSIEVINDNCRPIVAGHGRMHTGVDIAVPTGTPVHATKAGKVIYADYDSSYGYHVRIDHGFGFVTLYGHNSKLLVTVGQFVNRGDIIALSGSTGASTGPHVHYQIELNGVPVDPFIYVKNHPPVDTSIQ